jgi:uncharacterized protein (DUF2267 family)
MSAIGLEGIDQAVQQTHIWINEVESRLGWDSKPRAYRLLRAVLHALRDHLQVNEAADLGAQLPLLIRGLYYEQWQPAKTPLKERDLKSFLDRIDAAFNPDPIEDTAQAASAVLALLSDKVSAGEIDDVQNALPKAIRVLWPGAAS